MAKSKIKNKKSKDVEIVEEELENSKKKQGENQDEKKSNKPETIEEQLEKKQQEIEELKDKLLRKQAEFDNYRKRAFKDVTMARQSSKIDTVSPILNVYDTFAMAVMAANQSDNIEQLKVGLDMISNEFTKALDDLGITKIEATGQKFDHNLHEAISSEASEEVPEGVVIKQWKCGYKLGDYIIRPATVVVSSGAPTEEEEQQEGGN